MKPFSIAISIFALAATLAAAPARAPQSNAGLADLHVGGGYSNCFFDLHPELTQAEFDEFAGELGSILRFRQLADPATLGRGRVDVSLQYASTPLAVWRRRRERVAGRRTIRRRQSRSRDRAGWPGLCRRFVPLARAHRVGRGREGVAGQLRVPRRHAIPSPRSVPVTA